MTHFDPYWPIWPISRGHIDKMLTIWNTNLIILVKMSGQPASYEQWFGRCEYDCSAPLVYISLKSYFLFPSILDSHLECLQDFYHLWVIKFLNLMFSGFPVIKSVGIVQTCPPKSAHFFIFCIFKTRYQAPVIFWNFWILIFWFIGYYWLNTCMQTREINSMRGEMWPQKYRFLIFCRLYWRQKSDMCIFQISNFTVFESYLSEQLIKLWILP